MSTWNLGLGDVSEETHAFRNKLASKDGHIAAQQTQLMKQAAEMDDLKASLNDALHKLTRETNRVLQLESDLASRSEDLRNEKITSQNIGQALSAAQEKIKLKDLEVRDLEANLDTLSHTSDGHKSRSEKLEKEKTILEARVRELEANQFICSPITPGRSKASRPRSSSLSNFRITSLEQELRDLRIALSQKETEMRAAGQKLSQVQGELIKTSNERIAAERRALGEVAELRASLDEKEEEIQYLKQQQGDGSREEMLLERIEEDEAKIAALETLLRDGQDGKALEIQLKQVETRLKRELERLSESEERHIELIREKEEALDELQVARTEIQTLNDVVSKRDVCINQLATKNRSLTCTDENTAVDLLDMDTEDSCHTPVQQDATTVIHVERLLAAIERLRGERDDLQRSMHFLESESKFAIDALEAKLNASAESGYTASEESSESISHLKVELDALQDRLAQATNREAETILVKDQSIKRLSLAAMGSAVVIEYFHSESDRLQQLLVDACASRMVLQERLDCSLEDLEELEQRLKESEVKLGVTVLCLEATTSQRDDLISQLNTIGTNRETGVEEIQAALQETHVKLQQTTNELSEVSSILHDTESERDSLTLQVTNLMTDLRVAQDELAKAESRYSSLQFHQLSSMSSNEATQVLQGQIDELEMRVMRRTEQIGIHQHDIKRLETNLRLQEERLIEMTMELETMSAQKNAMVEDCADAREARDNALERLDILEMEMEAKTEEEDDTVAALVGVIIKTIGGARDAIERSNRDTEVAQQELHQLTMIHLATVQTLDKMPSCDALASAETNATQLTLALALSQVELTKASAYIQDVQKEKDTLFHEVRIQQNLLEEERKETVSLQEKYQTLENQTSEEVSSFTTRTIELEAQIQDLQRDISSAEVSHRATIDELSRLKDELQISANTDSEGQLDVLKTKHIEELAEVRAHLAETSSALEALREQYVLAEAEHQAALSEAANSKQVLEQLLEAKSESLRKSLKDQEQVGVARSAAVEEGQRLRKDLDAALLDIQQANGSREELQNSYHRVMGELAQARQDQARATETSLETQQQLECDLADLRSSFDSQSHILKEAIDKADDFASQLREEIEARSAERKVHDEAMQVVESALNATKQEIVFVQDRLEQATRELSSLQEEKLSLQEEITTLEAEIQRSISLRRFLESQVKESEQHIAATNEELVQTQADLARSEKATKAAEVNLGLQGVQHKREVADLQREVTALRSRPDLRDAMAELEERNNEMEELLRAKCTEIEENDDRTLEMLKDNKKLTTKVESLSRKVQNLQAKLAAAKASIPTTQSRPSTESAFASTSSSTFPTSRTRSSTFSDVPPVPPLPSYDPSPAHRGPLNRAVSGPSSLPRPKTPERRAAPPPVFKARTPERRVTSVSPEMGSASTIGKKRRAPDDFEACESLPPQGFTADSLPSDERENATPRVRRIVSNSQAGFTPVRQQSARPTLPMPSPKRSMATSSRPSPLTADMTNSPATAGMLSGASAKASKRSWLGKIRGVSSQTTGRSGDSRPRFERGGELS